MRLGLINSVEVAAVLPYHLWDIAERLALLSGPERRQASILRDLDVSDPDVQVVLGPQRKRMSWRSRTSTGASAGLEEFAALAAKADAARKRRRALEELAGLNGDYRNCSCASGTWRTRSPRRAVPPVNCAPWPPRRTTPSASRTRRAGR